MRFRIGDVEMSGTGGILATNELTLGDHEVTAEDTERSGRDGVVPGAERLGGATWELSLATNYRNGLEAAAAEAKLRRVWQDPNVRKDPRQRVEMYYRYEDRDEWRVVYGRPRDYQASSEDVMFRQGRCTIEADFLVTDHRRYSAEWHRHVLTVWSSSSGGISVPLVAPLVAEDASGDSVSVVHNRGDDETPVMVKFYGPITNPVLEGPGWSVGLETSVAHDEEVTVDSRVNSVRSSLGRHLRGSLTLSSWLSDMRLPVGPQQLHLRGSDPTGQSQCEVLWRDAYLSL